MKADDFQWPVTSEVSPCLKVEKMMLCHPCRAGMLRVMSDYSTSSSQTPDPASKVKHRRMHKILHIKAEWWPEEETEGHLKSIYRYFMSGNQLVSSYGISRFKTVD